VAVQEVYEFDGFRLDAAHAMLYRDGRELPLPRKAVETLQALVKRPGEILSKDELMSEVWSDIAVEESNLALYLHILRKTLGQKKDSGHYIETLRRRGYRFSARVKRAESERPPIDTSKLIGRETEIAEIAGLFSRKEIRIVILTGVGGVGKTTLARAVFSQIRDEFHDGGYFVELASIERPELIPSAIAAVVGQKIGSEGSPLDDLSNFFHDRELLLVLDNLEHLISGIGQIIEIISAAPKIKILVTSRVQLRLTFGHEFVVSPLAVPKLGDPVTLADSDSYPSIELFHRRASSADPNFAMTLENAGFVAGICTQLDGLPLAIELAASRVSMLSPEAILPRLESKLKFLVGGPLDMPHRQQTMRGALAWSWDLLDVRERKLFAQMSVFTGSFGLSAAEAICVHGRIQDRFEVLEGITSLVQHNLVTLKDTSRGDPRFHMLEVVREFALEMLTESGEFDAIHRRHAEYFLSLGETAEQHLQASRSSEWLGKLETEHDNLRAAFTWSLREEPGLGQRAAAAIWKFWWLHGHIHEGCVQLDAFLSQPIVDQEIKAKLLAGAAALNRLHGNLELSRMYAEEAAALARQSGDLRNGALSLHQLGFLALDDRDFEAAGSLFSEGLSLANELGDKQVLGLLNNGLGELARMQDDLEGANQYYLRSLQFNTEAGDRVRQTTSLINLGATAVLRNEIAAAGDFYRRGLQIASEMDDMNGTIYSLEGIAGTYWAKHDPATAAKLYGFAEEARLANNLHMEAADRLPYERSISKVRNSLSSKVFDILVAEGHSIKLNAAVKIALSESSRARN
jgi:predicted ATPase